MKTKYAYFKAEGVVAKHPYLRSPTFNLVAGSQIVIANGKIIKNRYACPKETAGFLLVVAVMKDHLPEVIMTPAQKCIGFNNLMMYMKHRY